MTTRIWSSAGFATLLAIAACAHHEQAAPSAQGPSQAPGQPPDRAQAAAQHAANTEAALARAQQRLAADRRTAAQAEQQRTQARQRLSQTEQRLSEDRQRVAWDESNVQRLATAARDQRAAAEEAAIQSELAAEQAQGLRLVDGRIAEASPTRVILEDQNGRTMAFQVEPRTRVLVGTEQRSLADLQQGAEARVAYDPREAEPAAVAIHVSPARELQLPPNPPQPAAQPPQPGAAQPGAPRPQP